MLDRLPLCVVLSVYGMGLLVGALWGLPSAERNTLYSLRPELCVGSGASRLYVTGPLQTFQVDEASALGPLARMRPEGLDFNPHFFHWGSLHTYVSGALIGVGHVLGFLDLTRDPLHYLRRPDQIARLYLVGRFLSMTLGLCTVVLVYRLGARGGGWLGGFLAAAFLSSSAIFFLYSRFFTPDVCAAFLFLLSVLLSVRAGDRGGRGLWGAAAVAGLATSVKYNAALALVAVAIAAAPYTLRKASRALVAFTVGFIVGTPYAAIAPSEFLEGVSWQWRHAGSTHGLLFLETDPGWWHHLTSSLAYGLGWPLLAVVLGGAMLTGCGAKTRMWWVVGGTAIAYYAVVSSSPLKFARYVLPMLPLLAVLAGWGWSSALHRLRGAARAGAVLVVGAGVVWGVMLCAWHGKILAEPDVRLEAGRWLSKHAGAGETIALFQRPYFSTPPIDADRFHVKVLPLAWSAVARLEPDWIVITDYEYGPYLRLAHRFPGAADFIRALLKGEGRSSSPGYRVCRFFRPVRLGGLPLNGAKTPHDLRYTHPTIVLLQRRPD